jgi:hypothetical protein
MIKPQAGLALVPLLLLMPYRVWFAIAMMTLISYALPVLWLGKTAYLKLLMEWKSCLQTQQNIEFMISNLNQSLAAAVARAFRFGLMIHSLTYLGMLMSLGVSGVIVLRLKKRWEEGEFSRQMPEWILGFSLASYLVFSPLSWRWMSFIWWPLLVLLWGKFRWRAQGVILFLGAITLGVLKDIVHTSDFVSYFSFYAWLSVWLWYLSLKELLVTLRA